MFVYQGVERGETDGGEDGSVGKNEETEERKSERRIQDQEGVRLSVLRERQGWGVVPLADKVC